MSQIVDQGPVVSEADVARVEQRLGIAIPRAYREFLLECNGGCPEPNIIDVAGMPGSPTDVQVIFGVKREHESSCLEWNIQSFESRIGPDYLPVACDSGGGRFVICRRSENLGVVFFLELEGAPGDRTHPPQAYRVAEGFDEFVAQLREF